MIWSGEKAARCVSDALDKRVQIQPNGIDLTVHEISIWSYSGIIGFDEVHTKLPLRAIVEEKKIDGRYEKWTERHLSFGWYQVEYAETIRIPKNAIGLVFPRSTLLRIGATVETAVWDSGFKGRGVGLLHVVNSHGITIYHRARIAQIVYLDAQEWKQYDGRYMEEAKT